MIFLIIFCISLGLYSIRKLIKGVNQMTFKEQTFNCVCEHRTCNDHCTCPFKTGECHPDTCSQYVHD